LKAASWSLRELITAVGPMNERGIVSKGGYLPSWFESEVKEDEFTYCGQCDQASGSADLRSNFKSAIKEMTTTTKTMAAVNSL
jgi:hypothetical protein